jgi:hypothetical protein
LTHFKFFIISYKLAAHSSKKGKFMQNRKIKEHKYV